jgi:predicted ATPase
LEFERVHAETYRRFGHDCIMIPPGPPSARAQEIADPVR